MLGSSKILYVGDLANASISGLSANTEYYYAVYTFNGNTLTLTNYNPTAAFGSGHTFATPPATPTNLAFPVFTGNSIEATWNMGVAEGSIVLVNTTGTFTPPVNGVIYTGNSDYLLAPVLGGSKIVYVGNAGLVNVTNLAPGTTYYFAVYNYNGNLPGVINYNPTPATGSQYTIAPMPGKALNITFTNIGIHYMTVGWTRPANTDNVVVLGNLTGIFPAMVNGVEYTVSNPDWTLAPTLDGAKVLYIGGNLSVPVTGLAEYTKYYYAIYTFNGTGLSTNYYPDPLTGNQFTAQLPVEPIGQDRVISFRNVNALLGTMDVTWLLPTTGWGTNRILTYKVGAYTAAENPIDGSTYVAGNQIGASTVLYNGTAVGTIASPVHVTGLVAGITYYFRVFAYNTGGNGSENYNVNTAVFNPREKAFSRGTAPDEDPIAIAGESVVSGFQLGSIAPNPASTDIRFNIDATASSQYTFEIYSVDGSQVISTSQQLSSGSNTVSIQLNNLTAGTYLLKVSTGNSFAVQSFIVIP